MDFGLLPPEVNSGRIYAGPGSGPMTTAAGAWDSLATDLYSTATSYQSVITGLIGGPWLGPASVSMAVAVTPYVTWLCTTAVLAEEAGAQAKLAAAAYEAAFAMTVPPPVIAANRVLLMALIATNFFGQNTPAIAATEAHYAEMWAQDAAAMYGYAGTSAAASTLSPFTEAPTTTNTAGLAGQFSALAQAAAALVANDGSQPFTTLYQLIAALPGALQGLASPTTSAAQLTSLLSSVSQPSTVMNAISILNLPPMLVQQGTSPLPYLVSAAGGRHMGELLEGLGRLPLVLGKGGLGSILGGRLESGLGPLLESPSLSASLGNAPSIGGLSVPSSWASAAPAIRLAAADSPAVGVSAAPASTPMPGGTFGQSLLGTLAGRAVSGTASKVRTIAASAKSTTGG
jgi:PPE-repeat protein